MAQGLRWHALAAGPCGVVVVSCGVVAVSCCSHPVPLILSPPGWPRCGTELSSQTCGRLPRTGSGVWGGGARGPPHVCHVLPLPQRHWPSPPGCTSPALPAFRLFFWGVMAMMFPSDPGRGFLCSGGLSGLEEHFAGSDFRVFVYLRVVASSRQCPVVQLLM